MRLDKIFSNLGILTRKEVKEEIKKGKIKVNNEVVKKSDFDVNVEKDGITYKEQKVVYEEFVYYILNKPEGVITAREDNLNKTVMDLIDDPRSDLSPVGRLDKDTTGLLIITNDGAFLHELMSPKKHVSKTYKATIQGKVTEEDTKKFKEGLNIGDDKLTLPAELNILKSDEVSEIEVTIYEGRYHQVKRMFKSVGKEVLTLERISIGNLKLDESIKRGSYIKVTKDYLIDKIYN